MAADLATLTASPQNGKFGMASLLQPELVGNRQPQQAPLRKAQGNYTPKAAYAAELQQQMAENQRRRSEQAAKEKLQEKKELEANVMRENLQKYNAHVGKGNDQLAFGLQQVRGQVDS